MPDVTVATRLELKSLSGCWQSLISVMVSLGVLLGGPGCVFGLTDCKCMLHVEPFPELAVVLCCDLGGVRHTGGTHLA